MRGSDVLASKKFIAAMLALAAVFGYASITAFATQEYSVIVEKIGETGSLGYVEHEALLKNNTLYGSRLAAEKYPLALVKELNARYVYESKSGGNGSYTLTGNVIYSSGDTVLWKDELFRKSGSFEKSAVVSFSLNVTGLRDRIKNVTSQLGVRRMSAAIVFDFATVSGEETFDHSFRLVMDPVGLLYFENGEKVDVKPVVSKSVQPNTIFGIDVRTARMTFLPPFLAAVLPAIYGSFRILSTRSKKLGIERYVVDGRFSNVERVVMLEDIEDLKRTFELVDKPVIKCTNENHEVYAIIDDGIAYVYRRKAAE